MTPWRDPLPKPGPVIVFDIDGVVANMSRFEHLLDSNSPRGWDRFAEHYKDAGLIDRGARLVDLADEAGIQVVWSTTRPDAAAEMTWRWLRSNDLPTGPIMTRHMVKDGSFRPAVDVKVRHWFWWIDKYGDRNPVIAWVEDERIARGVLISYGCPAWTPKQMQRAVVKSGGRPLLAALAEKGYDHAILERSLARRRPGWQKREDAYQEERSKWWDRMRMKSARDREQRLATRAKQGPPH